MHVHGVGVAVHNHGRFVRVTANVKHDFCYIGHDWKQESPAVAYKPARRESMPKIAPIRRSTCLQRCRWHWSYTFIRLAVGPSEICEIPRNSPKIQTYRVQGHPRSSINWKRKCTFLLVLTTNSNFGCRPICYRFRDIDAFSLKIACFPTPPLFDAS